MRLLAFQGYRYTPQAGDPQLLAAPPFDQIDAALRDRLHGLSPHQFAHLTRPAGDGATAYPHARELHRRWLEAGIIARDKEPSLYPYVIDLPGGSRRRGVCALVGVGPSSAGDLKPHEETVDKPLEDRLALLETMRVDLEPVMLLAEDTGELDFLIDEDLRSTTPLVAHRSAGGDVHSLYRVSDRDRIECYQSLLRDRYAAIADGHHRTKVAQLFAQRHSPPEGTAACAKLAVLISLAAEDLVIDPIHRGVRAALDKHRLARLVSGRTPLRPQSGRQLAAAVAEAVQPALGVWFRGSSPEVWRLDPERVPEHAPGRGTPLPVVLLHYLLLRIAGLGPEAATDGTIEYRSDPDRLYQLVEQGDCPVGFWLPPMSPAQFATATADGDVLPPKSTRFLPKLVSGLVWAGHDAAVR